MGKARRSNKKQAKIGRNIATQERSDYTPMDRVRLGQSESADKMQPRWFKAMGVPDYLGKKLKKLEKAYEDAEGQPVKQARLLRRAERVQGLMEAR